MDHNHFIICSCQSPEHTIQFVCKEEREYDDDLCYVQVQLIQYRSFFQRVVVAIKYIFGYQCKYGHWDCTSLGYNEAKDLRNFLNYKISEIEKQ